MTTPTEAMRLALDALKQVRKQADSANGIGHLYEGDCPDPGQPDARDAGCPACKTIDASDAAITALRAALVAAPQPPAAQQGEHLLQDQDRGLSQWLASQPDARLRAREAAAAIAAQQGEAVAIRSGMCQRCGKWAGAHATLPGQPTDHLCRCQPTAAPQPVALKDHEIREAVSELVKIARECHAAEQLRARIQGVVLPLVERFRASAPAWVVGEPVATLWQHCETGRTRVTMPDQVFTQDATWDIVGPLYLRAAPTARQALTDERIAAMRQAGYLDADDYPDAWAYERGVRDAERAHGIGGKGGA